MSTHGSSTHEDLDNFWKDLKLPNPSTIVDVGANFGSFSRALKLKHPDAKITAIEPNPSLIPGLEAIEGLSVLQLAVGSSIGKFSFAPLC
jgi:FkbM family methyltransferase